MLEPNTSYTFTATATNSCDNTNTLVINATTAQACYFVDQAIPDNGVLQSTFTVVGNAVQGLRLTLGIDHPRAGDLRATLSRLNRSAVVFDRPGFPDTASGCDRPNVEVVLSDGASVVTETQCELLGPALAGPVMPDEPMSTFDGVSAAGDWILTIEDLAAGQAGQLVEWCLSSGATPADRLSPMAYTVTPLAGNNGALDPSTPQAVLHGNRVTLTAAPDPGFGVASVSGCDGSLSGTTYTTGGVTADCSVQASFLETTGTNLAVDPNPARVSQPASFLIAVSGSQTAPADGQVIVDASTGEGCSTAGPAQINGTMATFGCSIAFATPGPRTISASFSNSATHLDSDALSLNLEVMRFADLSVSASDGLSGVNPGDTLSYLVEVRSSGPDAATGTMVATMIDPELTGTQWSCSAINGAMCPAASGIGMLAEVVSLPADGGLDYLVEGQLGANPPPSVLFTAAVTEDPLAPNFVLDTIDANNVATDVNVVIPIFDNGFE